MKKLGLFLLRWAIFVVAKLAGLFYLPAAQLAHYLGGSGRPRHFKAKARLSDLSVLENRVYHESAGGPEEVGWTWDECMNAVMNWCTVDYNEDSASGSAVSIERSVGAFYIHKDGAFERKKQTLVCRDLYDWHPEGKAIMLTLLKTRLKIPRQIRSHAGLVRIDQVVNTVYLVIEDDLWPTLGGRPFISYFTLEVVE